VRTLYEILVAAKDGSRPEYDELLYGLLALDALACFDRDFILSLPERPQRQKHLDFWAEETFKRYKQALGHFCMVQISNYQFLPQKPFDNDSPSRVGKATFIPLACLFFYHV